MQKIDTVQGGGKVLRAKMQEWIDRGAEIQQIIRLREVGHYLLLIKLPQGE